MRIRISLVTLSCLALFGCGGFPASRPVINSGSYDWTDQVRDAQGFPAPGWGTAIFGGDSGMSSSGSGM